MASISAQFYNISLGSYRLMFEEYSNVTVKGEFFVISLFKLFFLAGIRNNLNYAQIIFHLFTGVCFISLFRDSVLSNVKRGLLHFRLVARRDIKKFLESFWNLFFYLNTTSWAICILFSIGFLSDPRMIWKYGRPHRLAEILYFHEAIYYIHASYAVFFLNEWKKDSLVMFIHHLVTLGLLALSYSTRLLLPGTLVIFLHDSCDIFLEASKCLIKLRLAIIENHRKMIRTIGFALFVMAWFFNRLFVYPLLALGSCLEFFESQSNSRWLLLYYTLYVFLVAIYFMDLYWAMFIIRIVINALISGNEEIDDIREIEAEDIDTDFDSDESEFFSSDTDEDTEDIEDGIIADNADIGGGEFFLELANDNHPNGGEN